MRWYFITLFFFMGLTGYSQLYLPSFDLQGHRGARGMYPENTIPAFLGALDEGVTTLEMDVVVSRDLKLVVSHDPWISSSFCLRPDGSSVSKGEEKKLNIYQMNYEEVVQYDCGTRYNSEFPDQQKMKVSKPLLQDVIKAVEDHIKSFTLYEVDYNIEIKSLPSGDNAYHPGPEVFSDLLYTLLSQYLPMERVVIQSFDFRVLKYWHQKYPEVRLSALVANMKSVSSNLSDLKFNPNVYSPHYKLLTEDQVQYLHQRRIKVIPWTVNEERDMKALLALKVDGFITDYPNRARMVGLGLKKEGPKTSNGAH